MLKSILRQTYQYRRQKYILTNNLRLSKRKIQEVVNKTPNWINQGADTATIITNLESELSKIAVYAGAKSNMISETPDVLNEVKIYVEDAIKNKKHYYKNSYQQNFLDI